MNETHDISTFCNDPHMVLFFLSNIPILEVYGIVLVVYSVPQLLYVLENCSSILLDILFLDV